MTLRLPYFELSSVPLNHLRAVGSYLQNSSLGNSLVELVYLRISQINGCSFCLKKHTQALRAQGETEDRLSALAGWHACDEFTDKERAALAWAESLTHISTSHAPDDVFNMLRSFFSDQEISDLTFAVSNMNALNRIAISMRQ